MSLFIAAPLVVERGGRLIADGTVDMPITFEPDGTDPNGWGGLMLLGEAPTASDVAGGMHVYGMHVYGMHAYGMHAYGMHVMVCVCMACMYMYALVWYACVWHACVWYALVWYA